jgi:hypothetical protein
MELTRITVDVSAAPISNVVKKNAERPIKVWPLAEKLSVSQQHGEGMPEKLVATEQQRFSADAKHIF